MSRLKPRPTKPLPKKRPLLSSPTIRWPLVAGRCPPIHFADVDSLFGHFVERGQFTQALHDFDDAVGDVIHFFRSVEAAEAEADRGVGKIFANAQCLEHVAWFESCLLYTSDAADD